MNREAAIFMLSFVVFFAVGYAFLHAPNETQETVLRWFSGVLCAAGAAGFVTAVVRGPRA